MLRVHGVREVLGAGTLALAGFPGLAPAAACGDGWPMQATAEAGADASAAPRLAFRTLPAQVAVGQPFKVEAIVCPAAGGARPSKLVVDADMPEHRHGMNYRARVQALGGGRYRADGLMFHMPGRWRFVFDLQLPQGPLRMTRDLEVD